MKTTATLYFLFIYVTNLRLVEASNFQGGTITYKVLNAAGSTVTISLTQTYVYNSTTVKCNDKMIATKSPQLSFVSTNVECIQHCNALNASLAFPSGSYCTDYSTNLQMTVGQRSDRMNVMNGAYFVVAVRGSSWGVPLSLPSGPKNKWSISCLINLQTRSDGRFNTPPVATMISPIYIREGIEQIIFIPTIDADNDQVRCRFANGEDECADVCPPASLPNGTKLQSNCTLFITGAKVSDWYAVAIMIEDFLNSSSTSPMSSIPVQFLIAVKATGSCKIPPHLTGPTPQSNPCVGVQVGQPFNITLVAKNSCPMSTKIKDIVTLSFPNVKKGSIVQNDTQWSVSLTWIPTDEQVGTQVLCAVAIDSDDVQSNQYCMTFTVAQGGVPLCPGQTVKTTTHTTEARPTSISSSSSDQSSTTSSITNFRQTTTETMIVLVQSTARTSTRLSPLVTSRSTKPTIKLFETSSTKVSPVSTMTFSTIPLGESSILDPTNDSTNSTVASPSSAGNSSRPWLIPLLAVVSALLFAGCMYFLCGCLCQSRGSRQQRPVPHKNLQAGNIIRPPNRSYTVYEAYEKDQNPASNKVRASVPADDAGNQQKGDTPLRSSEKQATPDFTKAEQQTSPSSTMDARPQTPPFKATNSYLFGNRHASKIPEP